MASTPGGFFLSLIRYFGRHADRPLSTEFGEDKLRDWYDGWQPLPRTPETRVTPDVMTDDLVARILNDLACENPQ